MNEELTIEKLLELPNKVLEIGLRNEENKGINLLSTKTCELYYYTNLKKDLKNYLDPFNDSKYSYGVVKFNSVGVSKSYGLKEERHLKKVNDNVLDLITREVDKDIFAADVYQKILKLADELTYREALYFVRSFLENGTDDYVCDELGLSRTGLQKIRKSCLVKMYLNFPITENRWEI